MITAVEAEPGMVVAAGTPVLRLAHDGPRDVVFAVPEDKLALIRQLAGVPGLLPSSLGRQTAPRCRPASARSRRGRPGDAHLPRQGRRRQGADVKLGQTATVRVELPQTAASPAATDGAEGGAGPLDRLVVDRQSMTVRAQAVQVAGADGNDAVITGGLQPGSRS